MQIYSSFVTIAFVSRRPDGFAAGLCSLQKGKEPAWRFVLGE